MSTVGVDGTMRNNPGALRTWHCSRSKKMDPPMVSVLPITWCRWGEANAQQLGRARNLALLAIQENGSASTSTQTTTTTHPPHSTSATKSACGTSTRTSPTHPEHHTRCVHVAHTYEHRNARVDNDFDPHDHRNTSTESACGTSKCTSEAHISTAHQSAHQIAHKPHISTAHDGTESRTPTETAHLKRTWGTSKVCSSEVCNPKVWCSKVWGSKAAGTGRVLRQIHWRQWHSKHDGHPKI